MYEDAMEDIKNNGLCWERIYKDACKDGLKRGFYNEYYIKNEEGFYLKLSAVIRGFREMDILRAAENENTRVRYFIIYTNYSLVNDIQEHPKGYVGRMEMFGDKNHEKVLSDYIKFYTDVKGSFRGIVSTKKEAFEVVKNLYLQKLDELKLVKNRKIASVMQPKLTDLMVEHLDNLNMEDNTLLDFK